MKVTITELRKNLSKYIGLAEKEDILVTRSGTVVAKITNGQTAGIESIFGILSENTPVEQLLDEKRMEM